MPDALFGALLSNVYCQATNQRLSHEMSIATKNKDGKIFEILAKQTDAVRTFLGKQRHKALQKRLSAASGKPATEKKV